MCPWAPTTVPPSKLKNYNFMDLSESVSCIEIIFVRGWHCHQLWSMTQTLNHGNWGNFVSILKVDFRSYIRAFHSCYLPTKKNHREYCLFQKKHYFRNKWITATKDKKFLRRKKNPKTKTKSFELTKSMKIAAKCSR